jgi:hypothetical protein
MAGGEHHTIDAIVEQRFTMNPAMLMETLEPNGEIHAAVGKRIGVGEAIDLGDFERNVRQLSAERGQRAANASAFDRRATQGQPKDSKLPQVSQTRTRERFFELGSYDVRAIKKLDT